MSKPGVRRLAIESLEDRSLLSIGSPTVAASIADSDICDIIYQEHFEDGTSGWGADNTGGEFAGLWHYSLGRRKDQLPNHSPDHSWYYGAFETSTGGGRFNLPGHRQGTLISPVLPRIPDCGKTTLSFNYLLDTRDNFDRDFVEVYVVEVDSGARTRIFSRAEGTLPETGNQWLTAISNSNLTPFAGETIRLEFVFNTGDPPQVDPEGWYVDDIMIVNCCEPISGYKWNDLDGDGIWDPNGRDGVANTADDELGLANWEIRAYADTNTDGILQQAEYDAGPAPSGSGITDADGRYGLKLAPGDYVVVEVLQEGWHQSYPHSPVLAVGLDTGSERLGGFGYHDTVVQGQRKNGFTFGNFQPTVAGTKFNDLDGDGAWDSGEPGLAGWTILAYRDSNEDGRLQPDEYDVRPAGEAVTVTDCRGEYGFALAPGQYVIVEVLQDGWHQSYPTTPVLDLPLNTGAEKLGCSGYVITVQEGTHATGLDFGNFQPTVAGRKFHDLNGDRAWEPDEPALAGWTIRAYVDSNQDGRLQQAEYNAGEAGEDVTDCRGEYGMVLAPGQYVIVEVLQDGWHQSYPTTPVLALPLNTGAEKLGCSGYVIPVAEGTHEAGLDFGNFQPTVAGWKFHDLNGNRAWEPGEPALPGWTIRAYPDSNQDGRLQQTEYDAGAAGQSVTDCRGEYGLVLDPGQYVIVEVLQEGWWQSYPAMPVLAQPLDTGDESLGRFGYPITVADGTHETRLDFGNFQPDITGYKWDDLNGDGDWDETEPGRNGVVIYIDWNDNGIFDPGEPWEVTQDHDGHQGYFALTRGAEDTVMIRETYGEPPQTYPGAPDFGHRVDSPLFGRYGIAEPPNFGNGETSLVISGYVWDDWNRNGNWDSGEEGLNGRTVYLDLDRDGMPDFDEPARVTGNDGQSDGAYQFLVIPGEYSVRVLLQDGWQCTYPPDDEHVVTPPISGRPGATEPPNFGNFRPDIAGYKWHDRNADAWWDDDEVGLDGWTIYLYRDRNGNGVAEDSERIDQAVTADGGEYWFANLDPGDYIVREQLQHGWKQSYPDSDDFQHRVRVMEDRPVLGLPGVAERPNFGNFQPDISGYKWHDQDHDGVWDDGEPGLNGWTIYLDRNDNNQWDPDEGEESFVTQYDGEHDGAFWFVDLPAATYTVREVLQHGWKQSYPDATEFEHEVTTDSATGLRVAGHFGVAESPNFGNLEPDISGYKWHDQDHDGVWDEGEPGLNGWTIYLDRNDNNQWDPDEGEESFVTQYDGEHDGAFWFVDLPAATYTVREVLQHGWKQSYPDATEFEHEVTTDSATGLRVAGHFGVAEPPNFGNFQPDISGYKWHDQDHDGVWNEGEPGLNGWTIYLDRNDNNQWDPDEGEESFVTEYDGEHDGAFWFVDLPAATYTIREVLQHGWKQSYPDATEFEHEVTIDPATGLREAGHFGETEPPNFGNFKPDISGYLWFDRVPDGVWDLDGEDNIAGTIDDEVGFNAASSNIQPIGTIYLDLNDNNQLDEDDEPWMNTQNDGEHVGAFWFAGLPEGHYTVRQVLPPPESGFEQTYPGFSGGSEHNIQIPPPVAGNWGEPQEDSNTEEEPNFGIGIPDPGDLRFEGKKFNDLNGNGEPDSDEPGLPGWEIRAYLDSGNGKGGPPDGKLNNDELSAGWTARTFTKDTDPEDTDSEKGEYQLTLNSAGGQYILVEVLQTGWLQTGPATIVNEIDPTLGKFGYVVDFSKNNLDFANQPALSKRRFLASAAGIATLAENAVVSAPFNPTADNIGNNPAVDAPLTLLTGEGVIAPPDEKRIFAATQSALLTTQPFSGRSVTPLLSTSANNSQTNSVDMIVSDSAVFTSSAAALVIQAVRKSRNLTLGLQAGFAGSDPLTKSVDAQALTASGNRSNLAATDQVFAVIGTDAYPCD